MRSGFRAFIPLLLFFLFWFILVLLSSLAIILLLCFNQSFNKTQIGYKFGHAWASLVSNLVSSLSMLWTWSDLDPFPSLLEVGPFPSLLEVAYESQPIWSALTDQMCTHGAHLCMIQTIQVPLLTNVGACKFHSNEGVMNIRLKKTLWWNWKSSLPPCTHPSNHPTS